MRWGIGRNHYQVTPGLYASGTPDADSPLLVSANYKLSFDCLRAALNGESAWLLVIDTKGINVWCAAGKGTFGTDEIVHRCQATRVSELVSHRQLIGCAWSCRPQGKTANRLFGHLWPGSGD